MGVTGPVASASRFGLSGKESVKSPSGLTKTYQRSTRVRVCPVLFRFWAVAVEDWTKSRAVSKAIMRTLSFILHLSGLTPGSNGLLGRSLVFSTLEFRRISSLTTCSERFPKKDEKRCLELECGALGNAIPGASANTKPY